MRLSMRTQYALRALTLLAMNNDDAPVNTRELATHESISVKFLEQVMLSLKNAGLVRSRRGRNGGYALTRPPADITLGELIRLMEGPESAMTDLADAPASNGLRDVMAEVDQATSYLLDRFTLEEICRRSR
jgi:Rrf2 family protein